MEACTEMWTCACLQSSREYICSSGSFLPCHSCLRNTSRSPWSYNSRTWWNYMDRQWFRNQMFKLLYWSVSQRTIRINNDVDGDVNRRYTALEKRIQTVWGQYMSGEWPTTLRYISQSYCQTDKFTEWIPFSVLNIMMWYWLVHIKQSDIIGQPN